MSCDSGNLVVDQEPILRARRLLAECHQTICSAQVTATNSDAVSWRGLAASAYEGQLRSLVQDLMKAKALAEAAENSLSRLSAIASQC